MSDKDYGHFINLYPLRCEWWGQSTWGRFWRVDKWEYFADMHKPLMFILANGDAFQPDKHFFTDFGSIPPPLMGGPTLSRTRFLPAYLFHDSAYRHGGLWFRRFPGHEFAFLPMTKLQADDLLYAQIRAWGGNAAQASTIYWAVRAANAKYPSATERTGQHGPMGGGALACP